MSHGMCRLKCSCFNGILRQPQFSIQILNVLYFNTNITSFESNVFYTLLIELAAL